MESSQDDVVKKYSKNNLLKINELFFWLNWSALESNDLIILTSQTFSSFLFSHFLRFLWRNDSIGESWSEGIIFSLIYEEVALKLFKPYLQKL